MIMVLSLTLGIMGIIIVIITMLMITAHSVIHMTQIISGISK